jgi:ribosomal peptide maturation radical SAM protein 1
MLNEFATAEPIAPPAGARGHKPRLALVFPPFGPSGMPSLGLGLLAARVKQAGFDCTTFYWSFEMLGSLAPPGEQWSLRDQLAAYDDLTQRSLYPANEWTFTRALYGDRPDIEAAGDALMTHLESHGASGLLTPEALLSLHHRAPDIIADFAESLAGFDVIGISTTFYQNVPALALARHVKARWPGKQVVLGGANVDGDMGPALFALFPFIDFIMQGEVDQTLVALLADREDPGVLQTIPGLLYRSGPGEAARRGPPSAPETRLASLPTPDYVDYIATIRRLGIAGLRDLTLALETSRGCWWGARSHCTFCGLNANGMGYRTKDADRAIVEIDEMVDAYAPRFLFMTDNIIALPHFDTLLPQLAERGDGPQFFYEIKSNMNREQMRRLAAARVTAVQPGIESFSTKVLKLMRKGVTAAQNVAMLKYAREYRIRPAYNIILGFPGEEAEDYAEFIRQIPALWHLMPPSSAPFIEFHRFSPYHADPASFGITLEPNPNYRLLYPDAGDALKDIAYTFVRTDVAGGVPDLPYFEALTGALHEWIDAFDWTRPMLHWEQRDDHLLVVDQRRARPAFYELHGFAAMLLHLLDAPRSVPALLRALDTAEAAGEVSAGSGDWIAGLSRGHCSIAFSPQDFRENPAACIDLLAAAGLIFTDSNAGGEPIHVALPLPHDTLPMHVDWADSHV